jgi:hypothetical protein
MLVQIGADSVVCTFVHCLYLYYVFNGSLMYYFRSFGAIILMSMPIAYCILGVTPFQVTAVLLFNICYITVSSITACVSYYIAIEKLTCVKVASSTCVC